MITDMCETRKAPEVIPTPEKSSPWNLLNTNPHGSLFNIFARFCILYLLHFSIFHGICLHSDVCDDGMMNWDRCVMIETQCYFILNNEEIYHSSDLLLVIFRKKLEKASSGGKTKISKHYKIEWRLPNQNSEVCLVNVYIVFKVATPPLA